MVSKFWALANLIPFSGILFLIYRFLRKTVVNKRISPVIASCFFWAAVLVLPWAITRLLVPALNWLFHTYPALQVPSWDVGLALLIYIGMWLSYMCGFGAAVYVTWKFFANAKASRTRSIT